ncbi:MAG: GDP-mannose 4,6-dehydratase [Magnetococcales bacterium]|nr:GDP-mannose 4,6-dehydratase [Magnetococcales bacterium]
MRILITGITGFVGSHMADFLLERMPDIELFGLKRWHLSRMDHIRHLLGKVTMIDCDLTDPIGTREMMDRVRPERIFHCAAESFVSPSWKHPSRYMTMNYHATVNLLDAIHTFGLPTLFHIPGSGEEYGEINEDEIPIRPETVLRPVNPYAVSKIAQDLIGYVYYKSYGVKVIRTRAFNHEGPRRDKVFGIPWYAYQIACVEAGLQEPLLKVGHIDDQRNFTHVRDMVEAYWLATEKCQPGELYLIGSEAPDTIYTFRQALERLIEMSTVRGIRYETDAQYVRPTNVPRLIADTSAFRQITGWEPKIPFQQILDETLNYWRQQVKEGRA